MGIDKQEEIKEEYLTEKEATTLKHMFSKYLQDYKKKPEDMSDKEWLENLFRRELPEAKEEDIKEDAEDIVTAISDYNENLTSVNAAAKEGISKEKWFAEKLQEASVGMAVNEYGQALQKMDDALYVKNMELDFALRNSSNGQINMCPNLDGFIAENMIAESFNLNANLAGKDYEAVVNTRNTKNSVDVTVYNRSEGTHQRYQLKFGKDAKATIKYIEAGDYNQRIIVPSEQLEEVREYFKQKGSDRIITDRIEMKEISSKGFTKDEMKQSQIMAQEDGLMPSMDYSHYQTKELAMSIGKNAGVIALQSAAITTGLTIAQKICTGEYIDKDEMVEIALKTGADTSVKVVSAGTLQVAVRKGLISFIPKATPAGLIANIACVGIENVKVLMKIASGEISFTKGLDQMGRTTVSMVGGLACMAKGAKIGASLVAWIPVVGPGLAVVTGFVGGMVGYFGGSKIGDAVYETGKKVANVAKNIAKSAFNGLKRVGETIIGGVRSLFSGIFA